MDDFSTIGGVLRTLYDCISGPDGGQDWERDKAIYHPSALITRTRIIDGKPIAYCFDFDGFRNATIPLLAGRSFYEVETARKTQIFGQIAHVFSSYLAKDTPESKDVIFRGINMIHLWHDGVIGKNGRWWIMSIIWDNEREGVSIEPDWFDTFSGFED